MGYKSKMLATRAAAARAFHSAARRSAAEAAATGATATQVTLNLTTPYQAFFKNAKVDLVQIPGVVGEYGVTAGHTPIIAQLKPGVIKVHVEREKEIQSFFTAGGFALTHANSVTDIACVELVKVEDIDASAAEAGLNKYKAALASAAEGTPEKVEAQIGYEVHHAMVAAFEGKMADTEVATGRGSQVIKVVMPTFIMAPTEDERFRRKKVCNIIVEALKELEGKEYDEEEAKVWCTTIADNVKARIRSECNFPRYKIVVQTFIGQQRLQDVRIASRCLWDNDHDNHASADFNSVSEQVMARSPFITHVVIF
ncbi:TPA: hypothetical protein N0F65_002113 [Lagenidium giganteum]|uniref:ATP synthase F1 complex delta/epsilon subunit N-terminal domain-containing protein n=1 Tax=Lagenidium giganteum TaxID=4803 RepID=A0AAV2ZDI7_9STRA|nr:TPA: hypothetical protein N0F65_002113 [Lagenidium giganteum]